MNPKQAFDLILYKAYADLRAEAARSYLGLLWWIIEPILYLSAFYVLFVMVFQRGGPDFVPSLLCGTVVWKWFASGLNGGGNSISSHGGLLQQVYVPKYVFPAIAMLGSTARFIPVFLLLVIFLLAYGIPARYTWLGVLPIMLVQFCLVLSLSMLLAAVVPFLPDIRPAIDNGLMLMFFVSGVFFNINEVHEPLRSYLLLNPMAGLIDEYRNVMIRGIWPDMERLEVISLVSIALGSAAIMLLRRLDHKYGKVRF